MDALKDIQSVVQISHVLDRLRNFRYDGSVCSEWSEPHPFIRQRNYVYKKAIDAKESGPDLAVRGPRAPLFVGAPMEKNF